MKRRLSSTLFLWCLLHVGLAAVVAAQVGESHLPSTAERTSPEPVARSTPRSVDEAVRQSAPRRRSNSTFYNKKMTEAQKKLLAPSPEDQAAYRDFLRQPHTGLVRLMPRGQYEFSPTIDASRDPDTVLPILGGGAFYSFTERTHNFGPWSEISFQGDKLIVGFTSQSLGLMMALGDVPLDSVTQATPGVEYLTQFKPPTALDEATAQRQRDFQGFEVDAHRYQSTWAASLNRTYVVRSVIYKKEGRLIAGGRIYVPHPYEYEGADALFAFRIVRVSEDGSLTILWKRLQKFSPPKIKPIKN